MMLVVNGALHAMRNRKKKPAYDDLIIAADSALDGHAEDIAVYMMYQEYAMLNTYLTGHPASVIDQTGRYAQRVETAIEGLVEDRPVKLWCTLHDKSIKQGTRSSVVRCKITDETGSVPAIAFGEAVMLMRPCLDHCSPMIVRGTAAMSYKDGTTPEVVIADAIPVRDARLILEEQKRVKELLEKTEGREMRKQIMDQCPHPLGAYRAAIDLWPEAHEGIYAWYEQRTGIKVALKSGKYGWFYPVDEQERSSAAIESLIELATKQVIASFSRQRRQQLTDIKSDAI
jgi:hypothetical protein